MRELRNGKIKVEEADHETFGVPEGKEELSIEEARALAWKQWHDTKRGGAVALFGAMESSDTVAQDDSLNANSF